MFKIYNIGLQRYSFQKTIVCGKNSNVFVYKLENRNLFKSENKILRKNGRKIVLKKKEQN